MNIEEIALRVAEQIEQRGRTYSPDHYVDVVKLVLAELSKEQKPVGVTSPLVGSNGGFSMCCFNSEDVPIGTKVFIHPAPDNTAEIEQRVAKACAKLYKTSDITGDQLDTICTNWREYL